MSSVRKALKISDVWQPKPAVPSEARVLPLGPRSQTPYLRVEAPVDTTTDEELLEEFTQLPASLPKAPLSFTARLVRSFPAAMDLRATDCHAARQPCSMAIAACTAARVNCWVKRLRRSRHASP